LELKKRFLELCLHEEDKTELRDTTRGLLVPSVAEGRLLLDPSSITVLEATHSVCNVRTTPSPRPCSQPS
jgi:hypothetical protein